MDSLIHLSTISCYLCIYLIIYLFIYLSIYVFISFISFISFIYLPIYLSIYLSLSISLYLSLSLSLSISLYLSLSISIYLSCCHILGLNIWVWTHYGIDKDLEHKPPHGCLGMPPIYLWPGWKGTWWLTAPSLSDKLMTGQRNEIHMAYTLVQWRIDSGNLLIEAGNGRFHEIFSYIKRVVEKGTWRHKISYHQKTSQCDSCILIIEWQKLSRISNYPSSGMYFCANLKPMKSSIIRCFPLSVLFEKLLIIYGKCFPQGCGKATAKMGLNEI